MLHLLTDKYLHMYMFYNQQLRERIFNHCLDTILPEDDNSLDWPTVVADRVKNILEKNIVTK